MINNIDVNTYLKEIWPGRVIRILDIQNSDLTFKGEPMYKVTYQVFENNTWANCGVTLAPSMVAGKAQELRSEKIDILLS